MKYVDENDDETNDFYREIAYFLSGCDIKIIIHKRNENNQQNANIQDIEIRNQNASTINNLYTRNYLMYNDNTEEYNITNKLKDNEYIVNNLHEKSCFFTLLIDVYKVKI